MANKLIRGDSIEFARISNVLFITGDQWQVLYAYCRKDVSGASQEQSSCQGLYQYRSEHGIQHLYRHLLYQLLCIRCSLENLHPSNRHRFGSLDELCYHGLLQLWVSGGSTRKRGGCASHLEFRYKWLYMGWTLEQRLVYVEEHWAYFLGFGMCIHMCVCVYVLWRIRVIDNKIHSRYAYHGLDILLIHPSLWSYFWSHLSKRMYLILWSLRKGNWW